MSQQQAYYIFASNIRNEIKKLNPDLPCNQINKIIGEKWRNICQDDLKYYITMQVNREKLCKLYEKRTMLLNNLREINNNCQEIQSARRKTLPNKK